MNGQGLVVVVATILGVLLPEPAEAARLRRVQLTEAPPIVARSPVYGTSTPYMVRGGSYRYRWLVACHMDRDSNRDGRLEFFVGYHGEIFGDRLISRLFTDDESGQSVDLFVASSRSGRFVAYVLDDVIHVIDRRDAVDHDLSALGAALLRHGEPIEHPSLFAFSYGHFLAFTRTTPSNTEVVLYDLENRALTVAYQTSRPVAALWFDVGGTDLVISEVAENPKGNRRVVTPALLTKEAKESCLELASLTGKYGHGGQYHILKRLSLSELGDTEQREETLRHEGACLWDGRRAVRQSSFEGLLVGSVMQTQHHEDAIGPLTWVESPLGTSPDFCLDPEGAFDDDLAAADERSEHHGVRREARSWGRGSFSIGAGVQGHRLTELNRAFRARGFSETGHNSFVAGTDGYFTWNRLRLGAGVYFFNPTNVFRPGRDTQGGALWGPEVSVSLGVEAIKDWGLRVVPELGIGFAALNIRTSSADPVLELGDLDPKNARTLIKTARLWHVGLRLESGIPLNQERTTHLTWGSFVAWRQQFHEEQWQAMGKEEKKAWDFAGPKVDLSGPIFMLNVGVTWAVMSR